MNTRKVIQTNWLGQRLALPARALLVVTALIALAVPTQSFAQAPTFNTFIATPKGGEPWFHPGFAAVGDYNGDGKLDAIVTDGSYNGVVRLLLGNGDGTFTEHDVSVPSTPTNPTPGVIKAADLNGDGRLDAVFVSGQGNLAPTVMINTGNDANGVPQFSVTTYAPFSSGIRSLTVGDLNGDGRPDFIVGNAYGSLQVYLNNGNGTFTAGQATNLMPNVGGSTGPGVIADLNGDGKADYVVTSNQAGAIDVFFGNGDGTLQAPVVMPSSTTSLAVADVNGDGKLDLLAVANGAPNQLLVYLNTGGGSFGAPTSYSTGGSAWNGWTSVTTADLNGDGKLDVVTTNSGSNNVAVFLGDGSGTFGAPVLFTVNVTPFDVTVRDFNGDGKPDIATAGQNDNTYGVLLNTTVFAPPLPTQTLTILGGSGNVGAVAANVEYLNPATGNWQPAYLTGSHPWGFVSGTNSWINYKASAASDPGVSTDRLNPWWYLYRVRITVPADAHNPKMTFSLKADNWAQVGINGVSTGPWIEGTADNVNADAVFSQNLHPGENTITINVGDYGGLNGFNFRIDLSVESVEPLVQIPAAPPADTTPPVIIAPADITTEATGPTGKIVTFNATAVDAVDGPVPVLAAPASGSTFPLGATKVGLGASDAAGNMAYAEFRVTVQDTTPPVITPPANIVAEATSAAGAAVTFTVPNATDLVSGSVPVAATPASGSTFPLGVTTVALGAADAAGNAARGSFTVTVRDTTAPVIRSLSVTPAVLWPPNHKLVGVTLTAQVSDAADPAPRTRIVSVSSMELPKSSKRDDCDDDDEHDQIIKRSKNDPDWVITGNLTLQLRAERSGKGGGRVYTITVESKDASGNVSTGTVTVTVPKSQGQGRGSDKNDDKNRDQKGDKDDGKKG